jgi:hypothetical protein
MAAPAPHEFAWVCEELRRIASEIKRARLYVERLRRAGEPVADLEARLREQIQRYTRMLEAFPECRSPEIEL